MKKEKSPYKPYLGPTEDEKYKEKIQEEQEKKKLYSLKPVEEEELYEEKEEKEKRPVPKTKISVPILEKMIKDMQATDIEKLQTIGSKVMGSLPDRIQFLRERIDETQKMIREREALNSRFNEDIDKDIEAMEKILMTISEREEIREFRLNITLLRMEKRKENTSFWKDMVQLRTQLRELMEEYQTESKINEIFAK